MHSSFIEAALDACAEVNEMLQTNDESLFDAHQKGAGGDISYTFDLQAETIFHHHLGSFGTIYSEESGELKNGSSPHTIILDPVDGSDNFKSGIPYYGTSIALMDADKVNVALVCNFVSGECFIRTSDAFYTVMLGNREKRTPVNSRAYSKTGLFEKAYEHPQVVEKLHSEGVKFRSPGAVALSLAYAHYVDYVLFLGTMRSFDLAAGLYLCRDLYVYQDDHILIIAKQKERFEQLTNLLKRSSSELT